MPSAPLDPSKAVTTQQPEAPTPSTSTPTSGTSTPTKSTPTMNGDVDKPVPDGKDASDTSKLKTFLSILRKFIGVSDIAAVRFSLPAQLMEPIPNLEYWHYMDRPDTFIAIGDSEDELGRMLGCLRFWFTKDLKYVKGKPCKPYNSTLGEFFRCTWQVEDTHKSLKGEETKKNLHATAAAPNGDTTKDKPVRVSYITEQTSHHPPVSAYYVDCPDKGISARGYDQLSAKFTGTSVRVIPGEYNLGIFVTLHQRDEEYQLTHPAAYLGGFLRGNLNVTVQDTCFVTCAKTGIKVILHYKEEGYFGKTQNRVEGVVYKCDVGSDQTTKISDVPDKSVLGRIDGNWREKIYFSYGATAFKKVAESDKVLLVDLDPLFPVQKITPPMEEQLPNESPKFWNDVTEAIKSKQFATATTRKQELEETQRQVAAKRKAELKGWMPIYFTEVTDLSGKPHLNEMGRKALEGMHDDNWHLEIPEEYGQMCKLEAMDSVKAVPRPKIDGQSLDIGSVGFVVEPRKWNGGGLQRQQTTSVAAPPTGEPDLVVLCSWAGAASKHIAKYTHGYTELFPNATILLLESSFSAMLFDPDVKTASDLVAAYQRDRLYDLSSNDKRRIVLHTFSNGGANNATSLAVRMNAQGKELHFDRVVLDSCPGQAELWSAATAVSFALPNRFFVRAIGWYIIYLAVVLYMLVVEAFRLENPISRIRRHLNDARLFPRNIPRLYLFTKGDILVKHQDVHDHVEEARRKDYSVVREVLFETAPHCAMLNENPKRYWEAVKAHIVGDDAHFAQI